jgi:hypothetical protein
MAWRDIHRVKPAIERLLPIYEAQVVTCPRLTKLPFALIANSTQGQLSRLHPMRAGFHRSMCPAYSSRPPSWN